MEDGTKISAGNKRRVQVRKERKDAFSAAKKQVFLDHLAGCCTVKRAAAAAGVTPETVNNHRRNDPVFAQQVCEALDFGYDNVEAMSLEWAARGGHYVPGPEADKAPGPETLDREWALRLLGLRRRRGERRTGRAGYEPRRVSEKELNESILAKLDVLDRRLGLKRAEVRKLKTRKAVAERGSPSTSSGRTA